MFVVERKVWDVAKNINIKIESDERDSEKERACNVAKTHLLCKADVYKEKKNMKAIKDSISGMLNLQKRTLITLWICFWWSLEKP